MRQCSRCWEVKEETGPNAGFSPKQSQCKVCRAEIQRHALIYEKTGRLPLSSYVAPRAKFIEKLVKRFDGITPLEIPVKSLGHIVEAPRACLLKRDFDGDWYHIASQRGTRQVAYNTCGPIALIEVLGTMGLELILPNERLPDGKT